MSYRVERSNNDYLVVEADTENVVQKYKNERKARDVCRNLNLGSGFQGLTPKFFCGDENNS